MQLRSKVILAIAFLAFGFVFAIFLWREVRIHDLESTVSALRNAASTIPPAKPTATPEQIRITIASNSLAAARWMQQGRTRCTLDCRAVHSLVWAGEVTRGEEHLSILIFRSDDAAGPCPNCAPELSLFEFRDGIALATERLAFGTLGPGGELAPADVTLRQLDDGSYAVVLKTSLLAERAEYTKLVIYRITSDSAELAFDRVIGERSKWAGDESSKPRINWSSNWKFVNVPGAPPDLLLAQTGISDGQWLDQVVRYRLVEGKFTESPAPPAPVTPDSPPNKEIGVKPEWPST